MKKIIIAGVIILCLLIAGCSNKSTPVDIKYYYSSNCSACVKMDAVMNNLTIYHNGEFVLTKYDVDVEKVKFYNDQIRYNGTGVIPFVIIDNNMSFNGYDPNDVDYFVFEGVLMHKDRYGIK